MHTFKDTEGRPWTLTINVDTIRRVKASKPEINLAEAIDGKLIEKMSSDVMLLCDVLCVMCTPEIAAKKLTEDDFYKGLAGDALDKAADAFMEELADFFPGGRGTLIRKALTKLKSLQGMALTKGMEMLDSPKLEESMQKQLNDLSSNALASLASTPGPSPSANSSE